MPRCYNTNVTGAITSSHEFWITQERPEFHLTYTSGFRLETTWHQKCKHSNTHKLCIPCRPRLCTAQSLGPFYVHLTDVWGHVQRCVWWLLSPGAREAQRGDAHRDCRAEVEEVWEAHLPHSAHRINVNYWKQLKKDSSPARTPNTKMKSSWTSNSIDCRAWWQWLWDLRLFRLRNEDE